MIPWLPNVIFGVMAILAGALTFLLPETLHRPLPTTIEEVEKWRLTLTKEEKEKAKLVAAAIKAREMEVLNQVDKDDSDNEKA